LHPEIFSREMARCLFFWSEVTAVWTSEHHIFTLSDAVIEMTNHAACALIHVVVNKLQGSKYVKVLAHVREKIDLDFLTDITSNGYVRTEFRYASGQRLLGAWTTADENMLTKIKNILYVQHAFTGSSIMNCGNCLAMANCKKWWEMKRSKTWYAVRWLRIKLFLMAFGVWIRLGGNTLLMTLETIEKP